MKRSSHRAIHVTVARDITVAANVSRKSKTRPNEGGTSRARDTARWHDRIHSVPEREARSPRARPLHRGCRIAAQVSRAHLTGIRSAGRGCGGMRFTAGPHPGGETTDGSAQPGTAERGFCVPWRLKLHRSFDSRTESTSQSHKLLTWKTISGNSASK